MISGISTGITNLVKEVLGLSVAVISYGWLVDKVGWLENWLVTPSHHRVHHAINPEYIYKNYGNVFILWDKWFGMEILFTGSTVLLIIFLLGSLAAAGYFYFAEIREVGGVALRAGLNAEEG